MRSNAAPQPVLQSYKRTGTNCPKGGDKLSQPPATISGWGKMPKDVLRSDISPAAKLVFAVIAAEMYDRKTVEMTHAEIGVCCHIAARHVKRSIKVLVAEGLVEHRRLSAGCVYQYRSENGGDDACGDRGVLSHRCAPCEAKHKGPCCRRARGASPSVGRVRLPIQIGKRWR